MRKEGDVISTAVVELGGNISVFKIIGNVTPEKINCPPVLQSAQASRKK